MGALANRFKDLDKSLDVGFSNLNNLVDNAAYGVRKEIEDTILGFNFEGLDKLTGMISDVAETIDILQNLPRKIQSQLEALFDKVLGHFMKLPYGKWGGSVFDALKALNDGGVSNFILESVKVGNVLMCNNLGTLMDFAKGYEIDTSIMEGLFYNLAADWANMLCKDFTKAEELEMSIFDVVENVYPYTGPEVEVRNVVQEFTALMGGYLRTDKYFVKPDAINLKLDYIDKNIDKPLKELYDAITPAADFNDLKNTMDVLDQAVAKYHDGKFSDNYIKLLDLRGDVSRSGDIDMDSSNRLNEHMRAADAFGSFIRNMSRVNLDAVQTHSLTDIEKEIFALLPDVIVLSESKELFSAGHRQGDWWGGKLDPIVNLFNEDILKYAIGTDPSIESNRVNGMHPTSGEFLRDGTYYIRPKPEVSVH